MIKYAAKKTHPNKILNLDYHKGLDQWWSLEVENTEGLNKKICHSYKKHDDVPAADILAVFGTRTDRTFASKIDLNNIRVAFAYPGRW